MLKKPTKIIASFLFRHSIHLFRLLFIMAVIFGVYFCQAVLFIFEWLLRLLEFTAQRFNLFQVVREPEESEEPYQAKFEPPAIDLMAKKIQHIDPTISQIQEKYHISYRQAKKVKDRLNILQNAPDIHSAYTG